MTGTTLKIIALIAMTMDHIGVVIFPQCNWMRMIGRIAFPIFAYMIAEGCTYTKNRKKYLLTMLSLGVGCQIVYYVVLHSLYQGILMTFSISIGMIYILEYAEKKRTAGAVLGAFLAIAATVLIGVELPHYLKSYDFGIDYGIIGIYIPVVLFFAKSTKKKVLVLTLGLVLLAMQYGGVQWWSLLAVPIICCYNQKRGRHSFKYLFYIYYPVHLVVIYLIGSFV